MSDDVNRCVHGNYGHCDQCQQLVSDHLKKK